MMEPTEYGGPWFVSEGKFLIAFGSEAESKEYFDRLGKPGASRLEDDPRAKTMMFLSKSEYEAIMKMRGEKP